jgi:hypothetical protein
VEDEGAIPAGVGVDSSSQSASSLVPPPAGRASSLLPRAGLPRPSGGSGRGRRGAATGLGGSGRVAPGLGAAGRGAGGLGVADRGFAGLFPSSSGVAVGAVGLGAAGLGASSSASPGGHNDS